MSHGFDIVSRSQWGARPPRSRTTRKPSAVTTVYIHWPGAPGTLRDEQDDNEKTANECVLPAEFMARASRIDTIAEERAYMREIQAFHMDQRGWSDFAYNYMIFRSGRVYAGRTFKVVPASQAPFNTTGVSICCAIGAADTVSSAMKENLIDFVRWCERYARHDLACKGHRQVNQTSCPGDRLMKLVPALDRI